jgi:hypothetical protein
MTDIGFDLLQGYHFAKPLSEQVLLDFVSEAGPVNAAPPNRAVGGLPRTTRPAAAPDGAACGSARSLGKGRKPPPDRRVEIVR